MKKAFLFIGTEKTGTTSVQRFLSRNRGLLIENGLLYPDVGFGDGRIWHSSIAASLMDSKHVEFSPIGFLPPPEDVWNQLFRELNSYTKHDLVLHSEHFSSRLKGDQIEKLVSGISSFGYDVKVVVYFRNHYDFFVSSYSTFLKSGGSLPFEKFFGLAERGSYYFDYLSIIREWERFVAKENLIVRSYEDVFASVGMEEDLLRVVGFDKSSFVSENLKRDQVKLNPSLGYYSLRLGWKINSLHKKDKFSNEKKASIMKALSRLKESQGTEALLDKNTLGFIKKKYEKDYDLINTYMSFGSMVLPDLDDVKSRDDRFDEVERAVEVILDSLG